MLDICPNYKNKSVFEGFNEMVEALGGVALTEEEFKSSDLRNQRTGLNYSAMNTAYKLYHANNGNFLDYAPNGEKSLLFDTILKHTNNKKAAILAKSYFYSDDYISQNGDWIANPSDYILDINGEPVLHLKHKEHKASSEYIKRFSVSDINGTFGQESGKLLTTGNSVTSNVIVNHMLENNLFSESNNTLAEILKVHSIPTKLSTVVGDKFMTTITDELGLSVILINPEIIGKASNTLTADTYLHEVVHALTVPAINNPSSESEHSLKEANTKVFKLVDKLFPKNLYNRLDRSNGLYALCNEKEFVAEFITNKSVRDRVYDTIVRLDSEQSKTLFGRVKTLINSISKFLLNRLVFKTNKDQLNSYLNTLVKFLLNKERISISKYKPSELSDVLFNSIDEVVANNDDVIIFRRDYAFNIENFEKNNAIYVEGRPFNLEEIKQTLDETCLNVAKYLSQRLAAIQSSNLSADEKLQQKALLSTQIQQFKSDQISQFRMFSTFMSQLLPQLLDDSRKMDKIKKNNLTTTDTEYMYQCHDNFKTYNKILQTISGQLDNESVVGYLATQIPQDKTQQVDLFAKDVDTLRNAITLAKAISDQGITACEELLIRNVRKRLENVGKETHSLEMTNYLNQLREIGYDTSKWFSMFGSIDRAKDNGLRALFHLVDKALGQAEMISHRRITELLLLQEKLSLNEHIKDLYELDSDGLTTGYLVRKYNYGQFFKDYNNFLKELNVKMGLIPSNRISPEGELGIKWNLAKNEWLSKHCERRFTKEYYEAYAGLSQLTRQRREEIQGEIRIIKEKALGEDGYYHYEKLTDGDFNRLRDLYVQKRILKSDYDINGNKKTGTELLIAKELLQLDLKLTPNSKQIEKNKLKWKLKMEEVFQQCGGMEEYQKGSEGNFDFKTYKKWIDRNCEQELKKDEEGHILLFKKIDSELQNIPTYSVNDDGGLLYQSLKEEYNSLINSRRDFNTGDVLTSQMTPQVITKLRMLDKEMQKIRKQAKRENKQVAIDAKMKAKIFKKYAKVEYSALYKKLTEEARKGGYLDQFLKKTGTWDIEEDVFIPYRWFTKVMPKEEYAAEFVEYVPSSGWMDYEQDSTWINDKFDESEGMTMVPKAFDENGNKLYDNSKRFNKVTKKGSNISKLYDLILSTMKESNSIYTNRQFHDDYLLPLIPGSVFKRMRGKGFGAKASAVLDYIKDGGGFNDMHRFDMEYGQSVEDVLNNYDEFGEIIKNDDDIFGSETISGRRPDGRDLHMVPQYYTRKLADPSQISSDICGIVSEYYRQALTFKNKQEIKDTCESILDMMENRTVKDRKAYVSKESITDEEGNTIKHTTVEQKTKETKGDRSITYLVGRLFLNSNLYNMRLDSNEIKLGTKVWKVGKFAQVWRAITTAVNLGCNLMVAFTGALTSLYSHLIQLIVGHRYNLSNGISATIELIHQMIFHLNGVYNYIGNKTSNNKLMVLSETFNISNQGTRKYQHSNRNRLFNAYNENWCFGTLSACDFIVKSNIMLTVLMSYRSFRGKFVTAEDIRLEFYDKSSTELKQIMKEWKQGICLYDVMHTEKGYLEIDDEYKSSYENSSSKIHSRINKWAEDADGMATPTQKAAITTNFVGAAILTHRQYLPLMLQSRYGNMVYDYDTEQYEGGTFRSLYLLVSLPILKDGINLQYQMSELENKENSKISYITYGAVGASLGVMIDSALLSTPLSSLGLLAGAALGVLSSTNSNTKLTIKNKFNNKSSKEAYAESRARLQHIKQIAAEIMIYHLTIQPFVNALCAFADRDDDDKDKIAFLILSYFMNIFGSDSDDLSVLFAAFLGRRFQWESYTAYRFEDIFNNFKTVTAQTGPMDALDEMLHQLWKTIFPRENLLDTFLEVTSENEIGVDYVLKGLYSKSELRKKLLGDSRFTKLEKSIAKLIPQFKSYEQIFDSKSKRNYFEHGIMKLKD